MGTRSRIGLELKDGSILSAYHHWDGYPSWLGKTLVAQYNTKGKVAELIDGGDMSTCWNDDHQPEYYSARGVDFPPRLDEDLAQFFIDNEEYSYVFRNGRWVCYDMHQFENDELMMSGTEDEVIECILPDIVEIPA